MDVIDTFEFSPNQAVIFIRTFNSWHSVRPMLGKGSSAMRRTAQSLANVSKIQAQTAAYRKQSG
jgi:hypothetical protein